MKWLIGLLFVHCWKPMSVFTSMEIPYRTNSNHQFVKTTSLTKSFTNILLILFTYVQVFFKPIGHPAKFLTFNWFAFTSMDNETFDSQVVLMEEKENQRLLLGWPTKWLNDYGENPTNFKRRPQLKRIDYEK